MEWPVSITALYYICSSCDYEWQNEAGGDRGDTLVLHSKQCVKTKQEVLPIIKIINSTSAITTLHPPIS